MTQVLLNLPFVCGAPPAGPDNGVRLQLSVGACAQEMSSILVVAQKSGSFPSNGLLVSAGQGQALEICL